MNETVTHELKNTTASGFFVSMALTAILYLTEHPLWREVGEWTVGFMVALIALDWYAHHKGFEQ